MLTVPQPTASAAEAMLRRLKAHGVDFIYVNAGTDSAPLIEALAAGRAEDMPRPVLVTHENAAVGMAHGHTMVSGQAQAVMVHVSVGTANAVCALMNAARSNVPIFMAAGRSPITDRGRHGHKSQPIHWAQEMFDQSGMVREIVKWEYELRYPEQAAEMVDRALSIACAHPQGPVYVSLPREALGGMAPDFPLSAPPPAPAQPVPAAADAEQVASWLAAARRPLVVTTSSGQDAGSVARLAAFAERFGVPVVEHRPRYMCFPSDHPLHAGFDSHRLVAEADLVVAIEADVPWIPGEVEPPPGCKVVLVGNDPLQQRYPMRSLAADLALPVSASAFLDAMLGQGVAARRELPVFSRPAMPDPSDTGLITKPFLSSCLAQVMGEDDILVNEYWVDRKVFPRRRPGTYFATPGAAGLGWGLPAALGASQAAPGRLVVAAVGDGAYLFANPAVCHQVGAAEGLPVLTVVCNNAKWGAVEASTRWMYPDGHAVQAGSRMPLTRLSGLDHLERYVEISGGVGIRVSDRAELPAALARAAAIVREERRQAVVNVLCS